MSHAHRPRGDVAEDPGDDEERALTAKVLLMELANAAGPLTAGDLAERTLLSRDAVESALANLADAGLCTERPGDERRPPRYEVASPSAADGTTPAR